VGLYTIAFAAAEGAARIIVLDLSTAGARLDAAKALGATDVILVDETSEKDRLAAVRDLTHGLGADAVFECSGAVPACAESLRYAAPGGAALWVGAAVPVGTVPVAVYEEVVRRNVRLQGVWVSDTSHLEQAIGLVEADPEGLGAVVTHRFALEEANEALAAVDSREATKAVIEPVVRDQG
jgi:threonine dehydrogenase-like Zn-dependent dehydrogenase